MPKKLEVRDQAGTHRCGDAHSPVLNRQDNHPVGAMLLTTESQSLLEALRQSDGSLMFNEGDPQLESDALHQLQSKGLAAFRFGPAQGTYDFIELTAAGREYLGLPPTRAQQASTALRKLMSTLLRLTRPKSLS